MKAIYSAGIIGVLLVVIVVIAISGGNGQKLSSALGMCNVRGYTLYGDLITSNAFVGSTGIPEESSSNGVSSYTLSEDVVAGIYAAENDPSTEAIILEVDSWGGHPVAAEEIANALKSSSKPNAVLIRSAGLSAAYWAATGGDVIFASSASEVGSIGVIFSYLDMSEKNETEGITYNSVTSGKFKDMGSPYKLLSTEERALVQRDVDILNESFINAVSTNRNLLKDDVRDLADGSSMLGEMALEHGLIDNIGDQTAVENYLREKIGTNVNVCWNEWD